MWTSSKTVSEQDSFSGHSKKTTALAIARAVVFCFKSLEEWFGGSLSLPNFDRDVDPAVLLKQCAF
jgi:hypothetical protein